MESKENPRECTNEISTDIQDNSTETAQFDIWCCIRFVWRHKITYIVCMVLFALLGLVRQSSETETVYESTAVLYCPVAQIEGVKNVSNRDLMDDAVAVMREKKILGAIEEDLEIPWRSIRNVLRIEGNPETGIVNIGVEMNDSHIAYECADAVVQAFCEKLPEIVPVGDVMVLTEPEQNSVPAGSGVKKGVLFGVVLGLLAASVISGRKSFRKFLSAD